MSALRLVALPWVGFITALYILRQIGWLMAPPDWELYLFRAVNQSSLPSWMNTLAILARNPWTWTPLYLGILAWLLFQPIPKVWQIVFLLLLAVTLSDQMSASVIKPWAMRLRPCRYPETASDCRLLVQCGSGFSFISSHASNHFALAWTLGLIMLRRWKSTGLIVGSLWASLVSWSQMRVGVHFPLDIVFGAFLGILIALSLWLVLNKVDGSTKPALPS